MKKHILITICVAFCFAASIASAATVNVSIKDNFFDPQSVTINPGDTVVWTNNGSVQHTSTSGSNCSHNTTGTTWDSGPLSPGHTFQMTLSAAGTYPYFCSIHCVSSNMKGTITVNSNVATIPLPTSIQTFSFTAPESPGLTTVVSLAKPLGVGAAATGGNTLSLNIGLDQFAAGVDVYFLIYAPAIDPMNIYEVTSSGTVQPLSAGLAPLKANVVTATNESFGDIPLSALPAGQYTFAVAVTPAGDHSLAKLYAWITSINL